MAQTLPIAFFASRRRNRSETPAVPLTKSSIGGAGEGMRPKWTDDLPSSGFRNSLAADAAAQVSDIGSRLEGARQRNAEAKAREIAPKEIVVAATKDQVEAAKSGITPAQLEKRRRVEEALQEPEVQAFLDTIAMAEGRGSGRILNYDTMFGGGRISDLSRHPGQTGAVFDGDPQSAAGKYQIQKKFYKDASRALGLTDFSPKTQDMMAVYKMIYVESDIYRNLMNNNVRQAIFDGARPWASFPQEDGNSRYGKQTAVPVEVLEATWAGYRDLYLRNPHLLRPQTQQSQEAGPRRSVSIPAAM